MEINIFEDDVMRAALELIMEQNAMPHVKDPARHREWELSYEALKESVTGDGAQVTCRLDDPFNGCGCINILGKEIIITKPQVFATVAHLADNYEVYTKVDGTVGISFTFYGTSRIKRG